MAKKQVFYSFHFQNDVFRVQQIRNIGMIEDNAPVTPNDWEQIKRSGNLAIKNWIDNNMKYKSCVVVLIGSHTYDREWVKYEIEKAWNEGKGLLGIHIHNLRCLRNGIGAKGPNPFDYFKLNDGSRLSQYVPVYDPSSWSAYSEIAQNLDRWVDHAISLRK